MASSPVFRANTSPLKRSFDHLTASTEPTSYNESFQQNKHYVDRRPLSVSSTLKEPSSFQYHKRRNNSDTSTSSMLFHSTTIMSGAFPSFMSVYGNEESNIYNHALPEHDTKPHQIGFSNLGGSGAEPNLDLRHPSLERRGSLTSTTSVSTDSSPTTTNSTFDSPLMADQSPESSPESASSTLPPKSFQHSGMMPTGTQTVDFLDKRKNFVFPMAPPVQAPAPISMVEDPRKNLKKLTLDMKLPSLIRPGMGSTPGSQAFSTPASPLREPPKTGRRKPTNLSIRTPGFSQLSFGSNVLAIPPTPGQKPVLHQVQSSPSLPSLASPTLGPPGGMRLAMPNIAQNLRRESLNGSLGSVATNNLPSLREEPYQPPQSQEAPERGYTDGPCLIYDGGVYLYLEPTAEEAAKFDTVINVAKEIKSPFENSSSETSTVMSLWRNTGNQQSMAEPRTAVSEISFKSAFEWPSNNGPATPTTPRPISCLPLKRPEYLHVTWDHNSEILDDLFPLCRLIDERVQDGKKVLVHCQLGVSRSASLIIAYGLYKGYEKNFHSMYMSVKQRSQWVGPNMSLIYQLTDFKTKCDKGEYEGSTRQPKPEWFVYGNECATPTTTTLPLPATANRLPTPGETTSESRPALRLNKELPPVPPYAQKFDLPNIPSLPGPSERSDTNKVVETVQVPSKGAKKATPRVLPFRAMGYSNQGMDIPPHRPRVVPGLTFDQPSMDLAMQDVPAGPSLLSPRVAEFVAPPFGVTTAGDLATTTSKSVKPPPGAFPGGEEWRNSLFITPQIKTAQATAIPSKQLTSDPQSLHQLTEPRRTFGNIDDIL